MLPPLRLNLEFLPSPDPSRPGLVIRDPYHYSSATLLIPPVLVRGLQYFDGAQSLHDLQHEFSLIPGMPQNADIAQHLYQTLNDAGFLENDTYHDMKTRREAEFAASPKRDPAFAGLAYPSGKTDLTNLLTSRVGPPQGSAKTIAVASPHASPDGGWSTYRAAYQTMPHDGMQDRTFVILGTSHYGAPECFGLTRKPFLTPFGETQINLPLIDDLERAAPDAVHMEDYCYAIEHSIELQVIFLQHLYGANVKILPILCGPFAKSIYRGGVPEQDEPVARFFDALANIAAREGQKLFWILGVDMAHIGVRYGDRNPVIANRGEMLEVKERDLQRIHQLAAGDRRSYWHLVQEQHDDLRWCGSAPFYTFLKVMPGLQGHLLDYHQWQIDQGSVVSFGALRFESGESAPPA